MTPMDCWIYRSPRKAEMYLYLAGEDNFDAVPEDLLKRFGKPQLVMSLRLDPNRRLAREDPRQVLDNLRSQGYHLQLPPTLTPDLYHGHEA